MVLGVDYGWTLWEVGCWINGEKLLVKFGDDLSFLSTLSALLDLFVFSFWFEDRSFSLGIFVAQWYV